MLTLAAGVGLVGVVGAAGCGSFAPDPVDPLPADRIVFGVSGAAHGFAPPLFWALQAPTILVYGSGLVLRAEDAVAVRGTPSRYVEAQVDPLLVARFVADAERSHSLAGPFGNPEVTDLGSTRVWLHGVAGEQTASAYAFSKTFDDDVSWSARRRRRRLRSLIDDAYALIGDAGRPYVPSRVVVLEQHRAASDEAAEVRWPGPDPAGFLHRPGPRGRGSIACGELTGATAAAVYTAALENSEQRWLVNGTTRILVVNPLPVEIDC